MIVIARFDSICAPAGGPPAARVGGAKTAGAPAPQQQQAPRERPSRVEGRIAFLKAELKITDAQTPQWNAVADAMRKNDAAMRDLMRQAREARQQQQQQQPSSS